jgi:hypothetical protein
MATYRLVRIQTAAVHSQFVADLADVFPSYYPACFSIPANPAILMGVGIIIGPRVLHDMLLGKIN